MESVLLSDLLGTRYVIDDFARKLELALENNQGNTVDLSRCKFGPKSAEVLNRFYLKVNLINSTDAGLNELLKNNRDIALNPPEEYEILEPPKEFKGNELMEWITGTPVGKYKIKLDISNLPQELATVLFIMARPECELDLTSCIYDIFKIIKDHTDFDGVEDVLLLEAPYCRKCKFNEIDNASAMYIPYDIGTKRLVSFTDEVQVPKQYYGIIEFCSESIYKRFKQEEEKVYYANILDLLKFRGEVEEDD